MSTNCLKKVINGFLDRMEVSRHVHQMENTTVCFFFSFLTYSSSRKEREVNFYDPKQEMKWITEIEHCIENCVMSTTKQNEPYTKNIYFFNATFLNDCVNFTSHDSSSIQTQTSFYLNIIICKCSSGFLEILSDWSKVKNVNYITVNYITFNIEFVKNLNIKICSTNVPIT